MSIAVLLVYRYCKLRCSFLLFYISSLFISFRLIAGMSVSVQSSSSGSPDVFWYAISIFLMFPLIIMTTGLFLALCDSPQLSALPSHGETIVVPYEPGSRDTPKGARRKRGKRRSEQVRWGCQQLWPGSFCGLCATVRSTTSSVDSLCCSKKCAGVQRCLPLCRLTCWRCPTTFNRRILW